MSGLMTVDVSDCCLCSSGVMQWWLYWEWKSL